jgi:hypothetical protein
MLLDTRIGSNSHRPGSSQGLGLKPGGKHAVIGADKSYVYDVRLAMLDGEDSDSRISMLLPWT